MKKELSKLSISELLEKVYRKDPHHEVSFDGYTRMSYQELWEKSLNLAASLQEIGINKGDKIAVCLPNWNEFVVIYMAVSHLGAVIVPFNTRYRQDEVEYILRNSEAKIVFFTEGFGGVNHYEQFTLAIQRVASLERLITVRCVKESHMSYEQLLERVDNHPFSPVTINSENDVFCILYTSGSTGVPKGGMLSHSNFVNTAIITDEEMQCTKDDVFFVAVPLFHVFGMVPSILSTIAVGARMVLVEKYNAKEALEITQNEKVTVKHGVPTMFILELNHAEFHHYDLSSLRTGIIAAAPCPVEIVKRIRTDMGCDIVVSYGTSETSSTLTMTAFEDDDQIRAETVGKAVPGAEVKIVNEFKEEVAVNEVGEVACRGFGIMKGYYNMPEKTRESLDDDGWFYSGDLGTLDEQGNLRIVGRKKELIIRGGYNIYPREIEEVLYTHPDVMEVAIVGLPDTVLGEISCACVKIKPSTSPSPNDLLEFVRPKVADYKVPDKLLIMDEFPMTASGKIRKISLQEQLKEKLGAELR
ncbi:AMP-binding protein [Bacillus sp. JJ1566]|uniref:class I adenylate-forming enzyme family protein n=1 Tax=Bacillus sp. JJ1566 TaxID=3122961 RepID=UPI002FFF1C6E